MQEEIKKEDTLQNIFLNEIKKRKQFCEIYTINGTKLQGRVLGFDNYVVHISSPKSHLGLLQYKHAISSIIPDSGEYSS